MTRSSITSRVRCVIKLHLNSSFDSESIKESNAAIRCKILLHFSDWMDFSEMGWGAVEMMVHICVKKFSFPRRMKKHEGEDLYISQSTKGLCRKCTGCSSTAGIQATPVHGKKMKNAINQNQWTRINIFGKNIISVQVRDVYSICIKSYVTQKLARFSGHFLRLKTVSHYPRVANWRKMESSVVPSVHGVAE